MLSAIKARIKNAFNVSTPGSYALDAAAGKNLNDRLTRQEVYSTSETVVGTWIGGRPIYRRTVQIKRLFTATERLNVSSWYKCPTLHPADGMMMIRTEPFWHWDGNGTASSLGYGSGCQMTSQAWHDPGLSFRVDIYFNGNSDELFVRIGGSAKVYLIAVTAWYYKLSD